MTKLATTVAALLVGGCATPSGADAINALDETDGSDSTAGSNDDVDAPDAETASGDDDTGSDDDSGAAADTTDGNASEDDTDDGGSDESGDVPVYEPPHYPVGRTHSPVTPYVADRWHTIAERDDTPVDDVFMKVGASSTVSTNTLHCFAAEDVDLGDHVGLDPTRQYFLAGDADGSTPFDRATLAAQSGRHAGWAIAGDPSPIEQELAALSPRLALVHYGTNDLGFGATYADALQNLHGNMTVLLDTLIDQAVVPVVFGITRRGDNASANRWVATYNAMLRGMAQQRQLPFVDMFHAIDPLQGHGLSGDGLHLEAYSGGACVLTAEALEHGYNVRNLIALQSLRRVVDGLVDDLPAPDDPNDAALRRVGSGASDDPWLIETTPWATTADTTGAASEIDLYEVCGTSDESGPEQWFRLELDRATALRIMVFDGAGIDIDLHLIDATQTAEGCLERDDSRIEGTLDAGTYYIAADTWAGAGMPLSGQYLLVVVPCDDDDTSCAASL